MSAAPLLPESWPVLAPLIGPVMRATSSSSNFTRPSRALFFIWTSGLPTSHLPLSTYRAVSVFLQKHPRRAHVVDPSTPSPNVRSTGRRLPRRPTLRLEAPTRPIDLAELWSAGGIEGPSRAFVSKALHFASCGRRPSKPNLQDGPFLLLQPPITEASPHNTRQKIFPTSAQSPPTPTLQPSSAHNSKFRTAAMAAPAPKTAGDMATTSEPKDPKDPKEMVKTHWK